jgi:transcriptional regulator with XRE-family HTH domain
MVPHRHQAGAQESEVIVAGSDPHEELSHSPRVGVRRLKEWRRRAALSQADLASRAGVGRVTITRLERGQQRANYVTARKLATALDIPVDALEGHAPGERFVWFAHDLERVAGPVIRKEDV